MSKVELLLKPVNDGKNTLPMVKVDDQVFAYMNESLNTYPAVRNVKFYSFSINKRQFLL